MEERKRKRRVPVVVMNVIMEEYSRHFPSSSSSSFSLCFGEVGFRRTWVKYMGLPIFLSIVYCVSVQWKMTSFFFFLLFLFPFPTMLFIRLNANDFILFQYLFAFPMLKLYLLTELCLITEFHCG